MSFKEEIAAVAARLIVEDGLDYGQAKRKAVRQLLGSQSPPRGDFMPENAEIEEHVREYLALFHGDTQPQRLAHLRRIALEVMQRLQPWPLYLVGPVLSGTATEHSDVHLQAFVDSEKEFEIHLLNLGVRYEVGERPDFRGRGTVEAVAFEHRRERIVIALYPTDALRGALRTAAGEAPERMDLAGVEALLAQEKFS